MNQQTNLFDIKQGETNRDAGIQQACNNADEKQPGWTDDAYGYLVEFVAMSTGPFMVEQVGAYAEAQGLPYPPSKRAWGGVIKRAQKRGLVEHAGYDRVKNSNAHACIASVWRKAG